MMPREQTRTARRCCPFCEVVTDQLRCPNDGSATLIRGMPPADPEQLRPGSVVAERYRIDSLLGGGGFGRVFAAEDLELRRPVAVKVLVTSEDQERRLMRFFQEARVTSALGHPNTVRVYDFGQDDQGVVFIAMERLFGETLREQLRRRVFGEAEAARIGIDILNALEEAHGNRLVHRDLKPENVMLHREGDRLLVKVLDFGTAKLRDVDLTGASHVPCTPAFASPEVARGLEVDERSDIYSLGILLFQLVTGDLPFLGKNPIETLLMQAKQPAPDLRSHPKADVSDAFARIVACALEKSPAARFAGAAAMRRALEPCLLASEEEAQAEVERTFVRTEPPMSAGTTAPVSTIPSEELAPTVGPTRPTPPPRRRTELWLLGGLLVLVVLVAGLLFGVVPEAPLPVAPIAPTSDQKDPRAAPKVEPKAAPVKRRAVEEEPPPPSSPLRRRPERRRKRPVRPAPKVEEPPVKPPPPRKEPSVLDVEI